LVVEKEVEKQISSTFAQKKRMGQNTNIEQNKAKLKKNIKSAQQGGDKEH
jgi:hypothetical protein